MSSPSLDSARGNEPSIGLPLRPGYLAAAIFLVFLFPASVGELAVNVDWVSPFITETLEPDDTRLLRLTGEGRFEEAVDLGRARVESRPRSCIPYRHLVEAAAGSGTLSDVANEFQTMLRETPEDGFVLVGMALALRELKREEPAYNLMALAVRRGVPCPEAYLSFVELARGLRRLDEANVLLSSLERERPGDGLFAFGRAYLQDLRGDARQALTGYQNAARTTPTLAILYFYQAQLLSGTARFEGALFTVRLGIEAARRFAQLEASVHLLTYSGILLERLGREHESEEAFQEALGIARELRLCRLEAPIHLERALLMGSRGKAESFADGLARARACEDRLFSPKDRASYLNRLARALASVGETAAAESALQESLELARSESLPAVELDGEIQLALISLGRGESGKALVDLNQALEKASKLEHGRGRQSVLSALGATYESMGSYRRSLEYYEQALQLARGLPDLRREALALGNMALVYFRLGRSAEAILYSARATQLARDLKDLRLEAGFLQALAAALAGLGNYQQSEEIYQAALRASSQLFSPGLHGLVLAGWARVALQLGKTEDAKAGFEQALEQARSSENALVSLQALSGLAQCAHRQGNLAEAAARLEESLKIVESFRERIGRPGERINYLETRSRIYGNLASILIELAHRGPSEDHLSRAFQVVEQARARAILDVLPASGEALPGQLGGGRPLTSHRIRTEVLAGDELILEFMLGEPESFVWVVSRDTLEVRSLPPRREIERRVLSFLETISSPPRLPGNPFERHLAPARELFELLLGPARELISNGSRLIISADGILHHLPFEALRVEEGETSFYLHEIASISYIPSASVLGGLRRRPSSNRAAVEFLGVGQPNARWEGRGMVPGMATEAARLPTIPLAALEVRAVSELFPPAMREVYVDNEATELAVKEAKLDRFRILHFAAHALVNQIYPERSGIFLARDPLGREDGVLQMGEVLDFRLNADLVVLSGCETGLGPLLSAEGTVGFTWAFLSAGSSSVVVSLWNVNDRSTAEFMQAFYQRMREGESRARALASAKQRLMSSDRRAYRHPYFWAPFVLVGLP